MKDIEILTEQNPIEDLKEFIKDTGAETLEHVIWRAVYAGLSSDDYHHWTPDDRRETLYFVKQLMDRVKVVESN